MLGFAWLTLRQAREALKNGRLEEAQSLLSHSAAQGHKRSWELYQQVAQGFVERGERYLRNDNVEMAWRDLLQAEAMKAGDCGSERLRQALVRLETVNVHALLETGEPARAAEVLLQLSTRGAHHLELKSLGEIARGWLIARELAEQGEFSQALEQVNRVRRFWPALLPALERLRTDLEKHQQKTPALLLQLHEAIEASRWRQVLELSEQLLLAAPQHKEARKARSLAWQRVEPVTVALPAPVAQEPDEVAADQPPRRFLLWIDGVGGYLVCLSPRVSLGQAGPDATVDVPLIADVSRLHATITRDTEGYLLEAIRPVQVNGQSVQKALLRPNDRITLGTSCQVQFHQPVAVSTTARLEVASGQHLPLGVDAVLLMAETLVLGAGSQVHVTVPELKQSVVLFRHKDGLAVRCSVDLTVNGERCRERALLGPRATVLGEDVSFALEPAGSRLGRG